MTAKEEHRLCERDEGSRGLRHFRGRGGIHHRPPSMSKPINQQSHPFSAGLPGAESSRRRGGLGKTKQRTPKVTLRLPKPPTGRRPSGCDNSRRAFGTPRSTDFSVRGSRRHPATQPIAGSPEDPGNPKRPQETRRPGWLKARRLCSHLRHRTVHSSANLDHSHTADRLTIHIYTL